MFNRIFEMIEDVQDYLESQDPTEGSANLYIKVTTLYNG